MSRPLDVLAVMDADGRAVALVADGSLGRRHDEWVAHLAKHDEARAAVAELVEAGRAYFAALDNDEDEFRAEHRLRLALFGGIA